MFFDFGDLRDDMMEEDLGGYFAGGYGGSLMEAAEVESASPEELLEMAEEQGYDLSKYERSDRD